MLYEDSELIPSANIELFRTGLLKYSSEFYCCYIVVLRGKLTEAIISALMTHFNTLQYHHIRGRTDKN